MPDFEETTGTVLLPPTRRELRKIAAEMGTNEARYLVDLFYQMQGERITTSNEARALTASGEPHAVIDWVMGATEGIELDIKAAMETFCKNDPMASWAIGIVGIGPILAAGLVANLDRIPPETVGHWWRFAGLDPTMVWGKGQKRPYSAKLKLLCYKLGESFVRTKGHPKSFYGPLYEQRKLYEVTRNETGYNAPVAAKRLATEKIESTELRVCLTAGKLPPAAMDRRARRWVVKLFLSHFHGEAYRQHFHREPPSPYPIAFQGHAHLIAPPEIEAPAVRGRSKKATAGVV